MTQESRSTRRRGESTSTRWAFSVTLSAYSDSEIEGEPSDPSTKSVRHKHRCIRLSVVAGAPNLRHLPVLLPRGKCCALLNISPG
jgi:hypothetical protein